MFNVKKNSFCAQAVGEYVVIIALVVGVVTVMSMMIRRGLQARFKDANTYMITTVNAAYRASHWANESTPASVFGQYEPYYSQSNSVVQRDVNDTFSLLPAFTGRRTGIFRAVFNERTLANTVSEQAPPRSAN